MRHFSEPTELTTFSGFDCEGGRGAYYVFDVDGDGWNDLVAQCTDPDYYIYVAQSNEDYGFYSPVYWGGTTNFFGTAGNFTGVLDN
jgi:hypothetical protein